MSRFINNAQENATGIKESRGIDDSISVTTTAAYEDESTVPFPGGGSAEKDQQLHQRLGSTDTAGTTGTIGGGNNTTRMGRTPLRRLSTQSKSWSEAITPSSVSSGSQPQQRGTLSFSSAGHARPHLQLGAQRDVIPEKKGPRFIPAPPDDNEPKFNTRRLV
jgi:hypothetical protein